MNNCKIVEYMTPRFENGKILFGTFPFEKLENYQISEELKNFSKEVNDHFILNGVEYWKESGFFFVCKPISWKILKVEGDELFLICESVLDNRVWANERGINYENSQIREYLNRDFLQMAFTNEAQEFIISADYDGLKDKITLLSDDELRTLISSDQERMGRKISRYALFHRAYVNVITLTTHWFGRSLYNNSVIAVQFEGNISKEDITRTNGVRPACKIRFDIGYRELSRQTRYEMPIIGEKEVLFGYYPQARVRDNEIIKELEKANYLQFADICLNGNKHHRDDDFYYRYEPIRWQIIEKDEEEITIISPVLFCMCWGGIRFYDNSEIREYLNNCFIKDAFTEKEKKFLLPYGDDVGGDMLTILSKEEVERFFPKFDDRIADEKYLTDYAVAQIGYLDNDYTYSWWTRTPYERYIDHTYAVTTKGLIFNRIDYSKLGIRVVCKIKNYNKTT